MRCVFLDYHYSADVNLSKHIVIIGNIGWFYSASEGGLFIYYDWGRSDPNFDWNSDTVGSRLSKN